MYTDAKRIVGVEMNKEFCDLQNEIVKKYKMGKRVEILNKRIEDAVEEVRNADVVVLNNVFEFYLSTTEQTEIWRFLRANVKKGARIVSRPDVATALAKLDTGIVIDEWLKTSVEPTPSRGGNLFDLGPEEQDDTVTSDIVCYAVL